MQPADQASLQSLASAANSQLFGILSSTLSVTIFSKYGHFRFQKTRWRRPKLKLKASKLQWGMSRLLRPLFIQSIVYPFKKVKSPLKIPGSTTKNNHLLHAPLQASAKCVAKMTL